MKIYSLLRTLWGTKKWLGISLIAIVLAGIIIFVVAHKPDSKSVATDIDHYISLKDCKAGDTALGKINPKSLDRPTEKKLLNYESDCYSVENDYANAIKAETALQAIYKQERNVPLYQQTTLIIASFQTDEQNQSKQAKQSKQPRKVAHETGPVL